LAARLWGATPVRAGNGAYQQLQIDTFGEVLDALHHARCHDLGTSVASWSLQKSLLDHLETVRDLPDRGIWEFRGPELHFTYSKVMTWVAFDRAIAAVTHFGLDGPLDHWRKLRDKIRIEIYDKSFNAELNSFVQSYGSTQVDAATLLLPLVGFLPADDPRMMGTVAAIETHLMQDGCFIRRYDSRESENGLPAGEGAFLACSFWYADNLILQGKADDGRRIFEQLLDLRNETGLLPEQFDTRARRFLGNFPQALTHLSLVNTAYNLHKVHGPARQRARSNSSLSA
jgi:GH15 family glucan-1,4-alpha-glucosidase